MGGSHIGRVSIRVIALFVGAMYLAGCGGVNSGGSTTSTSDPFSSTGQYGVNSTVPGAGPAGRSLSDLASWDIWTPQARGATPSFTEVAHSNAQLIIVDPSIFLGVQPQLAKAVQQVRRNGAKRLIATLDLSSIGSDQPDWKPEWASKKDGSLSVGAPGWLESSKSGTTYPVQYWNSVWQSILIQRVRTLMTAGFDGIAPSGLDRYSTETRPSAAVEMSQLVAKVAQEARAKNPNAVILPLDGAGLIDALDDKQRPDLIASIDGMVGTGVFYGGPKDSDNDLNPKPDLIAALDKLDRADKRVLALEHLSDTGKVTDFEARARSRGYLPQAIGLVAGTAGPGAASGKTASWTTPASNVMPSQAPDGHSSTPPADTPPADAPVAPTSPSATTPSAPSVPQTAPAPASASTIMI